jgi:hemoglobin
LRRQEFFILLNYIAMNTERADIVSREDIELLVNNFYNKVRGDQLLSPVFANLDWPKHLPVMYQFWSSMILGEQTYRGNPFQKHMHLPIGREHFQQWLSLFFQTVDETFEGDKAEEIKQRATSIAALFQHRMNL